MPVPLVRPPRDDRVRPAAPQLDGLEGSLRAEAARRREAEEMAEGLRAASQGGLLAAIDARDDLQAPPPVRPPGCTGCAPPDDARPEPRSSTLAAPFLVLCPCTHPARGISHASSLPLRGCRPIADALITRVAQAQLRCVTAELSTTEEAAAPLMEVKLREAERRLKAVQAAAARSEAARLYAHSKARRRDALGLRDSAPPSGAGPPSHGSSPPQTPTETPGPPLHSDSLPAGAATR